MARLLPGFSENEFQMNLFDTTSATAIDETRMEEVILETYEDLEKIMSALANQDEITLNVENNALTLKTSNKIYKVPYASSASLTSVTSGI